MENENKKSEAELLKEKLLSKPKNAVFNLSEEKIKKVDKFCEKYKQFLDNAKTEREAVKEAVNIAKENGFEKYSKSKKYKAGDKFYSINRGKALILCTMGTEPLENGVKINAAIASVILPT